MFDHLLTEAQRRVRDDARDFVKATPRQLILDMDEEKVRLPREWLREAADARHARSDRDHAADAPEAEAAGEIVYE